jgi:hypothetical protein
MLSGTPLRTMSSALAAAADLVSRLDWKVSYPAHRAATASGRMYDTVIQYGIKM